MRSRIAGLLIGIGFGVVLSWSGMTSPTTIRQALLFQRGYLYLFFASAVLVSAVGLAVLRRISPRALLVDAPVAWSRDHVERRHVIGSLIFGVGWAISDACPGPIATQIGQGILWGVPTLAGVLLGVNLFLSRDEPETEPATDPSSSVAAPAVG